MRSQILLFGIAPTVLAQNDANVTTGELGNAIQNLDNPQGAQYRGVVTTNAMNITGSITAVSAGDKGTEFAVDFANLPTEGGPFVYHLHVLPVPSDGNCTSTLAHLDPYIRGETVPCTSDRPETCQVGDLSGKHGKINGTSFQSSYMEPFVSLTEGVGAFFGNRSFVIHFANKTRIACGNFSSLSVDDVPPSSLPGDATLTSIPTGGTATFAPVSSNNSAAVTSASVTAAATSKAVSLTTSTTFIAASTRSSSTSSAAPEMINKNAASKLTTNMSWLLVATCARLWWLA